MARLNHTASGEHDFRNLTSLKLEPYQLYVTSMKTSPRITVPQGKRALEEASRDRFRIPASIYRRIHLPPPPTLATENRQISPVAFFSPSPLLRAFAAASRERYILGEASKS